MTFLRPAGAVAFLAVAVLVALWRRERRTRLVPVSTLLFWRRIAAVPARARRLPVDPLFLLQLLLILALAVGYLRPATRSASRSHALVLVLDVSASMGTREADGTRFAMARRRARALVVEGAESALLVAAAREPRVVSGWTEDRARVLAGLETLEPLDVPGDLAAAVAVALAEARTHGGVEIVVLTDLPREGVGLGPAEIAAVRWIQIGRTDDNVAIASLTVDAPPLCARSEATATAIVRNYGARPRHAVLDAMVGGVAWEHRVLELGARATETVVLGRAPASGEIDVALAVDDALSADDVARAWMPDRSPPPFVVVGGSGALAHALRAIPGTHVDVLSADAWVTASPTNAVVVFDGVAPHASARRALYVAPPAGSEECPSDGEVGAATIVDWEDDDPALGRTEGLGGFVIPQMRRLATGDGMKAVVLAVARGAAFPVLVTGERAGRRVACLGPSLDGALGTSDELPLVLLSLGTIGWLVDAGAPLVVDTGASFAVDADRADEPGLRTGGGVAVADRVGTYRGGGRLVLANLFDERESDVGRDGGGEWPAAIGAGPVAVDVGAYDFGPWFFAAAAPLLAIEWLLWMRRRV